MQEPSVYAGLRAQFHELVGLGTWWDSAAISLLLFLLKSLQIQGLEPFLTVLLPFKNHYPPLPFSSFLCFLFSLKPYRMCIASLFDDRQNNIFAFPWCIYIQCSLPLLFLIIFFIFSFKALYNGAFRYFWRMKRERKVVERGGGWFFYFEIGSSCACRKL